MKDFEIDVKEEACESSKQCWRYEYRTMWYLVGYPLIHIALGRDDDGYLLTAKGWIAIGHFGVGLLVLAQFGIGFLGAVAQFGIAPFIVAQFGLGIAVIAQFAFAVIGIGASMYRLIP